MDFLPRPYHPSGYVGGVCGPGGGVGLPRYCNALLLSALGNGEPYPLAFIVHCLLGVLGGSDAEKLLGIAAAAEQAGVFKFLLPLPEPIPPRHVASLASLDTLATLKQLHGCLHS